MSGLISCNPFRLSLRLTLVLLCIVQVIVSCVIIWWLGYSNSISLIGSLSTQLRESALQEIVTIVHNQLRKPLRAVSILESNTVRHLLPNLIAPDSLLEVPGVLSDLALLADANPDVSSFVVETPTYNYIISAFNMSAFLSSGGSSATPPPSQTDGFFYGVQALPGSAAIEFYYRPNRTEFLDPAHPVPDFGSNDTLAQLGPLSHTHHSLTAHTIHLHSHTRTHTHDITSTLLAQQHSFLMFVMRLCLRIQLVLYECDCD